jgi:hypothetical protein
MVLGQLRGEMSRATLETWVQPLQPIGYQDQTFTLGAYNSYAREWVENRLRGRITQLLEGLYSEPVKLRFVVVNGFVQKQSIAPKEKPIAGKKPAPVNDEPMEDESGPSTSRKMMLQRAYGSERAKLIQPERGMFVTLYFFYEWLPLLGHSAFATILAARSLCYWNPMTGELRNTIETEMSELASRAAVSVRTVKDVLTSDLVQKFFLRYRVRRVMTPNGVRTAGISLQVRMDDPLTPQDQELSGFIENEQWYSPEFEHEDEES